MANKNPAWKGLVFGSVVYDPNGLVSFSSSSSGDNQSPESARSGVELESGVKGVESYGVLGDGSERKDEKGFVKESDKVCSVSKSPISPVAGEFSGEVLVSSSVLAGVTNGGVENERVGCDTFNEFLPFDFSSLSAEDAMAKNGCSGMFDQRLSYHHFGDHTPNGNANGFSVGHIDEMMSGLSVRDLITSSNVLSPTAMVNSSTGQFGGRVVSDQYTRNIHLNGQIGHYTPPVMRSLGHFSGSCNILAPSGLVNSSAGPIGGQVVQDQYTHSIHLNSQVSPYAPLVDPMTTGLALGASSSPSSVLNGVKTNFNYWRFNKTVLELAMSRDGSQYLIDMMASGDWINTGSILAAVATDVFAVIGNEYGLQLFGNLLRFCDHTQKEFLLDQIVSDPVKVILCSQNTYGSKALMELVDHLKGSKLVHQIPSILATEIKPMLHFASRLIQHCIFVLKPNQCERLYEAMIECACSLALDAHCCILLYNLIDNIKGVHRTRLLNKLADNSVQLATHPSGNYVVKRLLDLKDNHITRRISYVLRGSYKTLAMDKHGSLVVETCIQSVGGHFVFDEFLKMLPQELEELAFHQFGSYVIRKALQTTQKCNLPYHGELVVALLPGLARLEESPHGKKVYKMLKDETQCQNGRGKKQHAGRDAK